MYLQKWDANSSFKETTGCMDFNNLVGKLQYIYN